MKTNRRRIVPVALLAALVFSQGAAGAAAAEDIPIPVAFTGTSSQTLEYGEYWSFPVLAGQQFLWGVYAPGNAVITSTGAPSGFTPQLYLSTSLGADSGSGSLSAPYEAPPLSAGSYSFVISGSFSESGETYSGETSPAAQLTVGKAKLGIELRVLADPTNEELTVVTAKFTGRFVDEYQSSFFPGAALSPAGIWTITLTDSDGEVATERSVERAAGDDVLATSFYWTDAEPGEQYTASAAFTPEGASAANFSVTPATDFNYTAAESQRPVPSSTAAAEPESDLPAATGFSLPLWLLITTGVLIAGLAVLVTILSVRLSRRSTATTGETAA